MKKRGHAAAFEIPLLCDYATFAHGVAVLRAATRGEQLSEEACHQKHARPLALALPSLFPWATHVHGLRAAYAAYVWETYTCDCTFNRAAMRALGHEKLARGDVVVHAGVRLHDLAPVCFGSLP